MGGVVWMGEIGCDGVVWVEWCSGWDGADGIV